MSKARLCIITIILVASFAFFAQAWAACYESGAKGLTSGSVKSMLNPILNAYVSKVPNGSLYIVQKKEGYYFKICNESSQIDHFMDKWARKEVPNGKWSSKTNDINRSKINALIDTGVYRIKQINDKWGVDKLEPKGSDKKAEVKNRGVVTAGAKKRTADAKNAKPVAVVTLKNGAHRNLNGILGLSLNLEVEGMKCFIEYGKILKISRNKKEGFLDVTLLDGKVISGAGKFTSIPVVTESKISMITHKEIKEVVILKPSKKAFCQKNALMKVTSKENMSIEICVDDFPLGGFWWKPSTSPNISSIDYVPSSGSLLITCGDFKKKVRIDDKENIHARTQFGWVTIPYKNFASISVIKQNVVSTKTLKNVGNMFMVKDKFDNSFMVKFDCHDIGFDIFDVYFPGGGFLVIKGLKSVEEKGVRHLIPDPWLRPYEFSGTNVRFDLGNGKIATRDISHLFENIKCISRIGDLRIPCSNVKSIEDVSQKPRAKIKSKIESKNFNIKLTTKDGRIYAGNSIYLNCACALRSGYRLWRGGRLFRLTSGKIFLTSDVFGSAAASIEKLSAIEIDPQYSKSKKITVTAKSGGKLTGELDIDKITKFAKGTFPADAGLLLKKRHDYWIFFPMRDIARVDIK